MKQVKKKMVLALLLAAFLATGKSYGQIIVNIRPRAPRVMAYQAPRPGYVWVAEDWAPRGRHYAYRGGYWMRAPHPRAVWVPGYWQRHRQGYAWRPGYWR